MVEPVGVSSNVIDKMCWAPPYKMGLNTCRPMLNSSRMANLQECIRFQLSLQLSDQYAHMHLGAHCCLQAAMPL